MVAKDCMGAALGPTNVGAWRPLARGLRIESGLVAEQQAILRTGGAGHQCLNASHSGICGSFNRLIFMNDIIT